MYAGLILRYVYIRYIIEWYLYPTLAKESLEHELSVHVYPGYLNCCVGGIQDLGIIYPHLHCFGLVAT